MTRSVPGAWTPATPSCVAAVVLTVAAVDFRGFRPAGRTRGGKEALPAPFKETSTLFIPLAKIYRKLGGMALLTVAKQKRSHSPAGL